MDLGETGEDNELGHCKCGPAVAWSPSILTCDVLPLRYLSVWSSVQEGLQALCPVAFPAFPSSSHCCLSGTLLPFPPPPAPNLTQATKTAP